ncbi:MAG: cache domain-containing protein [bacterium]
MRKLLVIFFFLCLLSAVNIADEVLITANMPSEEIGEVLSGKSQDTAEKIRQIISERGKDLLILSKGLTSFAQAGRQEWAKSIIAFSKEIKDYPLIRIINTRGVEELKVSNGIEIKSGYADVSSDEFFKESIKLNKDQISVSSLEFNSEGIVVLRMSTPIYGLTGMEKAILSFDWDISEITNLIKKLKISDSSYGFVINPEAKILIHPEKIKMLKEKLDTDVNPEYKAIVQRMQLGESGWGKYFVQEKEYIIGFYFYPELDWSIGISYLRGEYVPENKDIPASVSVEIPKPVAEKTKEDGIKPVMVPTVTPPIQEDIKPLSAFSLKILKGALRTKNIDKLIASVKIEGRISKELTETLTIKLKGENAGLSQDIFDFWKLNENSFRKHYWEITSPELMAETRVLNESEAFVYYPMEKKVIKFSRDEYYEYFKLNLEKENKILAPLKSMDIENYYNDKIDMLQENEKMFYVLEMDMKTPLEFFGISLKQVKMKIDNEYFLPVLVEWYAGDKEKIVWKILENYTINSNETIDYSYTPKQDENIFQYREIKTGLIKDAGLQIEAERGSEIKLDYLAVKEILQEEIKKRGLIAARILASESNNFILNKSIDGLKNTLLNVWEEDWIDYIFILDNEGKKVIHTKVKESQKNKEIALMYQKEEISVPIIYQGRPVGSVKIGISFEKADYILSELMKKIKEK